MIASSGICRSSLWGRVRRSADPGPGHRHHRVRRSGEDGIVHPDQTDHAVRNRSHRDQTADCEIAGAEVGPCRPTRKAGGSQRMSASDRFTDAA